MNEALEERLDGSLLSIGCGDHFRRRVSPAVLLPLVAVWPWVGIGVNSVKGWVVTAVIRALYVESTSTSAKAFAQSKKSVH